MMRLIDKMQLVDTVLKKRYSQASINLILNQPEIEAIPIEWILKWACGFIDPNSEGYKMAMELVHDWEKENEV